MKELRGKKNRLADESGVITLDFIFALAIAFGFSILFFAISFTLSMVEVCQYITYSVARTYYAANVSQQAQEDIARQKYEELKGKGAFKTILKTGWITLGDVQLGNAVDDYPAGDNESDPVFVGARIPFNAKVLDLRLPFLGRTVQNSTTGQATLNAFLMREVSTQECQSFTQQRLSKLKELNSLYQSFQGSEVVITDNGC